MRLLNALFKRADGNRVLQAQILERMSITFNT